MNRHSLSDLLDEYDRALAYTASLVADLSDAELTWRADDASSSERLTMIEGYVLLA